MLIGLGLMGLGGLILLVGGAMFQDGWNAWKHDESATAQPKLAPPPAHQPDRPRTAAKKEAAKRQAFLNLRRPLQESVINAKGQTAVHEFDQSGIGQIVIPDGDAAYIVPISKNDGLRVWVYNTDESIAKLSRVGAAEHHEIIDVTQLRPVDRETSLAIGETVVIETQDEKVIQLLLIDAHVRANGDELDDARFKYEVYPPGTSQISALRNGS